MGLKSAVSRVPVLNRRLFRGESGGDKCDGAWDEEVEDFMADPAEPDDDSEDNPIKDDPNEKKWREESA